MSPKPDQVDDLDDAAEDVTDDDATDDATDAPDDADATPPPAKAKRKSAAPKSTGDDDLDARIEAAVTKALASATGTIPSVEDVKEAVAGVLLTHEHEQEHQRLAGLSSGTASPTSPEGIARSVARLLGLTK